MPHTAEEIWSYLEDEPEEFVQLAEMPEVETLRMMCSCWLTGRRLWSSVLRHKKALEEARNAKVIGKSLEAHLTAHVSAETSHSWKA